MNVTRLLLQPVDDIVLSATPAKTFPQAQLISISISLPNEVISLIICPFGECSKRLREVLVMRNISLMSEVQT